MFETVKIRDGHDNFFTPLRLIFALMVVFGHAIAVGLRDIHAEPMIFFQYKASYIAVNMFFIVSGFLVTKSMLHRGSLPDYSSARLLRIYPALIVHVLFVMFIMGPFVTNLPLKEFFTHPDFWKQPFKVLSFIDTDMVLPGALETNDEQIGSATLWTLRYEVLAYIGTALAFSLGLLRDKKLILAQFLLFALAWPVAHYSGLYETVPATLQAILRFGFCYCLGAAIYAYQDRLSFHIWAIPIIGLISALFAKTPFLEPMMNIWLAYIVFWAAYVRLPRLQALQKMDDISYGIYIYHWCILQWVFYAMPDINPPTLLAIALPITLALSYLSWVFVEKPMLSRKKGFAQMLRWRREKRPTLLGDETIAAE